MKEVARRFVRAIFAPFRRGLGIAALERGQAIVLQRLDDIEQFQVARFDSIDGRLLMIHHDVIAYREYAAEARDAMVSAAGQFGAEVARLDEMDGLADEIAHQLMRKSLEDGLPR